MKVVRVNHGNVFNTGNWYTFHCPKCSHTLQSRLSNCDSCNEPIEWESLTPARAKTKQDEG